eukprot:1092720-Amphidinium_carterae.2
MKEPTPDAEQSSLGGHLNTTVDQSSAEVASNALKQNGLEDMQLAAHALDPAINPCTDDVVA